MKVSTAEAASKLGLTVPELLGLAAPLMGDLSEAWPEIDDGYIATMEQLYGLAPQRAAPDEEVSWEREPEALSVLERAKLRILDKLERSDKWGGNAVSFDTLRNHYCQGLVSLDEALNELIDADLVFIGESGSKRKGPFSLNPAKKGVIERELARIRS